MDADVLKDPMRPKQPRKFFIFEKMYGKSIKEKNPDIKGPALRSKIKEAHKNCTADVEQEVTKIFNEKQKEFIEALEVYKRSKSSEYKESSKENSKENVHKENLAAGITTEKKKEITEEEEMIEEEVILEEE